MLSQLQGQLLGLLPPSAAVLTPRAAQGPALCLSFPILLVCSHPWVLLVSLSPLFPGTEAVVSVVCDLVAQFPEIRGSIHTPCTPAGPGPAEGVCGEAENLRAPWDANAWAGLGAPSRKYPGLEAGTCSATRGREMVKVTPAGCEGLQVLSLCAGMGVWKVPGALQDQSKQEHEGCDPTEQGLGLLVLCYSNGLTSLGMDSGLIQEFSRLGDATLWQPLLRGWGAVS